MLSALVFVAMPFGKKRDFENKIEIDFDRIYEQAIKPAIQSLGLEVIRADEERMGGIIHTPMYERLLLSEIVIADVSNQNPNVFYELGIRHCARPRSTILMFAKENQLPFDIRMLRAIPYELNQGIIEENEIENLKTTLIEKLKEAIKDYTSNDSPLFDLIPSFPGINLDKNYTASFKEKAKFIECIKNKIRISKSINELKNIENELNTITQDSLEIIFELIEAYKNNKAWEEVISLIEKLPVDISDEIVFIREQYAFALNRRNNLSDREKAIKILTETIDRYGESPETYGLLGRIYKDYYDENKSEKMLAKSYLLSAIDYYSKGFETDPRNYYPGVNAVTLLFIEGSSNSIEKFHQLLPAVIYSTSRSNYTNSKDYWLLATMLELLILAEDWQMSAHKLMLLTSILGVHKWQYESTFNNLMLIKETRDQRGLNNDNLNILLASFKKILIDEMITKGG